MYFKPWLVARLGRHPMHQKAVVLIPGQVHMGGGWSMFPSHLMFLFLSLPPSPSLKSINVSQVRIKSILCTLTYFSSPAWCGLVNWMLACKAKGHQFDSYLGHMPGLQAKSLVGGTQEATGQHISYTWMFLSLSFFLPPFSSLYK